MPGGVSEVGVRWGGWAGYQTGWVQWVSGGVGELVVRQGG